MNNIVEQQTQTDKIAKWKMFIKAGNSSFYGQQTIVAIAYYQKAITISEQLFKSWEDIQSAISTMLISHHNLADLFLKEGNIDLAELELRTIHQKLLLSLHEAEPNSPRMDALLWGVSRTYFALISHLKNSSERVKTMPLYAPSSLEMAYKNNLS
ncbi:hypothetical protein RS130_08255 [Paraglaciecola aquimarina]|uniref:TPR repeat-containing protein n=1 Tax=Paraglaciecola aquimarina TaxID=1235557 RepID=A0ABU3SV70_9ALTE|nr:hypothetical protein [Paraglaciecola aquimarina]MDU0353920.1 hypothetical protein [Paraglaciecola aquimarina]